MEIIEIEDALLALNESISPLLAEKSRLNRLLSNAKSVKFISDNHITKSDVQRCDDEGMQYFGRVDTFGKWLKSNSTKDWCCWNGSLYKTSEIIQGRMARTADGRYEDLEGA